MAKGKGEMSEADLALLDRIAALTTAGDAAFDDVWEICETEEQIHMPPGWASTPEAG